jgi:alpha/beta superfamily hydrolase
MRNQELVDKRFTQIEAKLKTLKFILSRPGASAGEFNKVITETEDIVSDLKALIERDKTPLRNG